MVADVNADYRFFAYADHGSGKVAVNSDDAAVFAPVEHLNVRKVVGHVFWIVFLIQRGMFVKSAALNGIALNTSRHNIIQKTVIQSLYNHTRRLKSNNIYILMNHNR